MKPSYKDILLGRLKPLEHKKPICPPPRVWKKVKPALDFGRHFSLPILVELLSYALPQDYANLAATSRSMAQVNQSQIYHVTIAARSPFFTRKVNETGDMNLKLTLLKRESGRTHVYGRGGRRGRGRGGFRPLDEAKDEYTTLLNTLCSQENPLALALSEKSRHNRQAYVIGERYTSTLKLAQKSFHKHEARRQEHIHSVTSSYPSEYKKLDTKIIHHLEYAHVQFIAEHPITEEYQAYEQNSGVTAHLGAIYDALPTRQRKLLRIYRLLRESAIMGNPGAYTELISLIEAYLPMKRHEVALWNRRLLWLGDTVSEHPTVGRFCYEEKDVLAKQEYEFGLPGVLPPQVYESFLEEALQMYMLLREYRPPWMPCPETEGRYKAGGCRSCGDYSEDLEVFPSYPKYLTLLLEMGLKQLGEMRMQQIVSEEKVWQLIPEIPRAFAEFLKDDTRKAASYALRVLRCPLPSEEGSRRRYLEMYCPKLEDLMQSMEGEAVVREHFRA
jgi:hypothetical protein